MNFTQSGPNSIGGTWTSTSYSCVDQYEINSFGLKDNKCTKINEDDEKCLCDTDDCNMEATSSAQTQSTLKCKGDGCNSAPIQSASQAITLFAFASMLKFALN